MRTPMRSFAVLAAPTLFFSLIGCSGIIPPAAQARTSADNVSNNGAAPAIGAQESPWVDGLDPPSPPSQNTTQRPTLQQERAPIIEQPSANQPTGYSALKPSDLILAGERIEPADPSQEKASGLPITLVSSSVPHSDRLSAADAQNALTAFSTSCPSLLNRDDRTGLTQKQDWKTACDAAATWGGNDASAFFAGYFESLQIGDGKAFATGYFEPEIAGVRSADAQNNIPVYRRPSDLVEVDLGQFSDEWKGKRVRGRVEDGRLVRYADRAAIEDGALTGQGLELAYAADPIEFFFLQIQGSGRLIAPDGSIIRIGYDGQNGHDYVGIGRVLLDEGRLQSGQADLEGIIRWLRDNPEEGRALMRRNASYIFFRELKGGGPLGALGWPVTADNSVAVDPRYVPMGAPVMLAMDRPEPAGLWVAQDTGGAIKGPNRFDTFWGAGTRARNIAGGMSARGQSVILVPKGTFARLKSESERRRAGQSTAAAQR